MLFSVAWHVMMSKGSLADGVIIYGWAATGGLMLTHLWKLLINRQQWLVTAEKAPWVPLILGILVLCLLQTGITTVGHAVVQTPGLFESFAWMPRAVLSWAFPFTVWTTLYIAIFSLRRAKHLESEALRLAVLAKEAELRALRAQVNPHFYFNSLNSLRALIFEAPEPAARMVDRLAGLMRYALSSGENDTVSLRDEVEAVQTYLYIEGIRFEERLRFRLDIEPGLDDVAIPSMVLQTLAENAVKYGVERSLTGSDILVSAKRAGDHIRVEVSNTGTLHPPGESLGLGLENARRRLDKLIGNQSEIQLSERQGIVYATIMLRGENALRKVVRP